MLKQLRQEVVTRLWQTYRDSSPQIKRIEAALKQKGVQSFVLDHFAMIDLPGPHTGISYLSQIFSAMGYIEQGRDYLPAKQNDFLWMAEVDSIGISAQAVLPQVVVADFRLAAFPLEIRKIIEKYSKLSRAAPLLTLLKLAKRTSMNHLSAKDSFINILMPYLAGRDWPLPTLKEFSAVQEYNALLAWVLVFGRRPNHFTLSVHHLHAFCDLSAFNRFITDEVQLTLNSEGGIIKGGEAVGIAQSSTLDDIRTVKLSDGKIAIPTGFVEFVWRYPHKTLRTTSQQPVLWQDFFTGFVAQHADHVIESLTLP